MHASRASPLSESMQSVALMPLIRNTFSLICISTWKNGVFSAGSSTSTADWSYQHGVAILEKNETDERSTIVCLLASQCPPQRLDPGLQRDHRKSLDLVVRFLSLPVMVTRLRLSSRLTANSGNASLLLTEAGEQILPLHKKNTYQYSW